MGGWSDACNGIVVAAVAGTRDSIVLLVARGGQGKAHVRGEKGRDGEGERRGPCQQTV